MHRPVIHPRLLAAVVGLAVLGLTGCTGPALGLLDQEQTEKDRLTIQTDLDGIDLTTTRFLAERDGVEYFAAKPVQGNGEEDSVCLLTEEGIGVGLDCEPLARGATGAEIRDSRGTAVLVPDDVDRNRLTDEGFELLHPNLAVRPADAG